MEHIILEGNTVTVEKLPELSLVREDEDELMYDPYNTAVRLPILTEDKMRELDAHNTLKNTKNER